MAEVRSLLCALFRAVNPCRTDSLKGLVTLRPQRRKLQELQKIQKCICSLLLPYIVRKFMRLAPYGRTSVEVYTLLCRGLVELVDITCHCIGFGGLSASLTTLLHYNCAYNYSICV